MTDSLPTFEQMPVYLLDISKRLGDLEQLILHNFKSAPEPDRWFNISEFCNYHPNKISKPTAYGYVQRNEVPFHKTGKCLRFLKSEIDAWLKEGKRKTISEIMEESSCYLRKK